MTVDTQRLRRLAKVLCIRTAVNGEMIEIQEAADQIDAANEQLAAYPADWRRDSSLETWFPLSAEQIDAQAAEIEALKHDIAEYVRIASEQGTELDRLRDALLRLETGFMVARDGADAMFRKAGNVYHEGRRVAYDKAAADVRAALSGDSK